MHPPLHDTPPVPHGVRGRQHQVQAAYHSWDFLKGEGPSAPERFYDPLETKAFKPGWQSTRREAAIQPSAQRQQEEAYKAARQETAAKTAQQQAQQRVLDHGFNPITGQEYSKATKTWAPAVDPWSHWKTGLRTADSIAHHQNGAAGGAGPLRAHLGGGKNSTVDAGRQQALSSVAEMRKERIAVNGLTHTKRPGGGVKELMQWST